jgi:antitoxin PrlF
MERDDIYRFFFTVFQYFSYTVGMSTKIKMNERGVITIPASLRQEFGLKANDEFIIERCEEGILLRPAFSVPIELYTEERIDEFARDEEAIGQHLPKSP